MQVLIPGDSGPLVQFVQQRLDQLGFGPLAATEVLDATTLEALERFQEARQIPETALVGDHTWLALMDVDLGVAGPLHFGGAGQQVPDEIAFDRIAPDGGGPALIEVQLRLRALGYPNSGETVNGPLTQRGLRAFQASRSLESTGAVDSETMLALRMATREAGPLFFFADETDFEPTRDPIAFGLESRDVVGEGGYTYRQFEDGAVIIVAGPSVRAVGATLRTGQAWAAITQEIGPFPDDRRTLARGEKGEAVRALQSRLNTLGFGPVEVDGDYGPGTETSLKRLQSACGLGVTGVVDGPTRARLDNPWPTLRLGYQGEDLRLLQDKLVKLAFKITTCNGSYTEETASAVRAFQGSRALPVTGEIDAITRGHILGAQGIALPDPLLQAEQERLRALAEQSLAKLPAEAQAKVRAVVMEAIRWVGKREIPKGSNGGPEIDVITADVVGAGQPRPPWCALAVSHWMKVGLGAQRWQDVPLGWRNASALAFGKWGEQKGRLLPVSAEAPAGSVFVMYREGSGSDAGTRAAGAAKWDGFGHTGMVIADLGDRVVTVDGNVGDRCWSCTRPKAGLLGFVRWW